MAIDETEPTQRGAAGGGADPKEIERALALAGRATKTAVHAEERATKAKEALKGAERRQRETGKEAEQRVRGARKRLSQAEKARSGEQATRDQAVWSAAEKGATPAQISERTGLSQAAVRKAIAAGPFGRRRSR